eukprot:CAMPEP_0179204312 /NCGR_PEP_ID=MMETSP0796-20121207/101850_1 /TAXON_ID=73915 /ORGANISM="Pyrodinium bahamense, Strain pbaha01" /LENGTH=106 /DNA_ID=CAMNT_0020909189 /DNA_START=420 /DNA_END=738 /DNA_ORIENTATION=-
MTAQHMFEDSEVNIPMPLDAIGMSQGESLEVAQKVWEASGTARHQVEVAVWIIIFVMDGMELTDLRARLAGAGSRRSAVADIHEGVRGEHGPCNEPPCPVARAGLT